MKCNCDNCKTDFPMDDAIIIPIEGEQKVCCGECGEWLRDLIKIREREVLSPNDIGLKYPVEDELDDK